MNTTAAALQAGVTTNTIRTWCRRGIIAAVKHAGRWIIDTASLAHRITIGKLKEHHVADQKYKIVQGTQTVYGNERTVWTIVRTDGTPAGYGLGKDDRITDATYYSRERAEIFHKFYENTPAGFRLERCAYRASSMRSGTYYWLVTGRTEDDPSTLRHTWDEGAPVRGNWPEGTTWLDVLISITNRHAQEADKRIQEKAEQDIVQAAEDTVREAREQQLAQARREKGELATPRQVDYILRLLAARERSGEGGGFFTGPTDRAGIELLSKSEASTYITSLKGDY